MERFWISQIPEGSQDGAARAGYIFPCTGNPVGQRGRSKMFRNSLFAVAASLMTLGTFASTIAIVTASSGAGVPVAVA
jgi:hypothetical protein